MTTTAKRGEKAPPRSKPGKWDKPEREASATKKGPGRKHGPTRDVKRVKEAGGYGKGLVASWTRKQLHAIEAKRAVSALHGPT